MTRISHLASSVSPSTQVERFLYAHALRSLRAYERAAATNDEAGMNAAHVAVVDVSICLGHRLERIVHRELSRIRSVSGITQNFHSI